MTENKIFAYGDDECDGEQCPSTAAGVDTMSSEMSRVSGTFDEIVRDKQDEPTTKGKGTISEKVAKESWTETMNRIRKTKQRTQDSNLEQYLSDCLEIAEKVSAHHGWEEDNVND